MRILDELNNINNFPASINSDEHDAKHCVRSGPEQQAPPRACEQGGASSSVRSIEEKQRGDVKRAGASARTSEHDRASSYLLISRGKIAAPLRTLRAPSAHSHMLRGPAYFVLLSRASFINF